jgi:YD repeat-containing protein
MIGLYSSADPTAYSFGYDTAGRAISQKQPSGSLVSWTVDADGNRTSLTWPETGALAYSTNYAYDAMNRMTDVFEGAASAGVLLGHYSYDAGNLTSDGTWTYTYSNENILLTATATGSTVSYAYDPQNLRKAKTVMPDRSERIEFP